MKCDVLSCIEDGEWRPVFIIPPPKESHPRPDMVAINAGLSLVVCGTHAAKTKLNDYLSTEMWLRIVDVCRMLGRVVPLRDDVTLAFIHRSDPKFEETNPARFEKEAR